MESKATDSVTPFIGVDPAAPDGDRSTRMVIVMDGGIIQDIVDLPAGVMIIVRDYDVRDVDLESEDLAQGFTLKKDEKGHRYIESRWPEFGTY